MQQGTACNKVQHATTTMHPRLHIIGTFLRSSLTSLQNHQMLRPSKF